MISIGPCADGQRNLHWCKIRRRWTRGTELALRIPLSCFLRQSLAFNCCLYFNFKLVDEFNQAIYDAPDFLLQLQICVHDKDYIFSKSASLQISKLPNDIYFAVLTVAEVTCSPSDSGIFYLHSHLCHICDICLTSVPSEPRYSHRARAGRYRPREDLRTIEQLRRSAY